MIRILDACVLGLDAVAAALERPPAAADPAAQATVDAILADVRDRGDAALLEWTARLDGHRAPSVATLALVPEDFAAAAGRVPAATREALEYCAGRIARFHAAAVPRSWRIEDEYGSVMGQEVRPLGRVGIYVPGGRARYPSSVLMTALPARAAGVRDIVLVTPPGPNGAVDDAILAAAHLAGVSEGWRVGGAQAVAALAYGTATIRRVDKIVGPGNVYVALAKGRVYGDVGVDMVAGPSEVLVLADASADPGWVAADLLAQAEHDPLARAVLVTDSQELALAVRAALVDRLDGLPRRGIAEAALAGHGALVTVAGLDDALALANRLAPEHLELVVREPAALLEGVRHAGAVFVGGLTPEVVGDYAAGPSHVLPTGGTARFASPLGVEDFLKRTSLIEYTPAGLAAALPHLQALSAVEGLAAHGRAAEARVARLTEGDDTR